MDEPDVELFESVGAASCRDLDEMRIDIVAESRSHGTKIPPAPCFKGKYRSKR